MNVKLTLSFTIIFQDYYRSFPTFNYTVVLCFYMAMYKKFALIFNAYVHDKDWFMTPIVNNCKMCLNSEERSKWRNSSSELQLFKSLRPSHFNLSAL